MRRRCPLKPYDKEALELKNQGLTYEEIAEKLGISFKQVNHALCRARKQLQIEYEDKKEYTDQDVDNYINQMLFLQEAKQKLDTKQVKATIRINGDKPIGIVQTGDWHIGGIGVDYQTLMEDNRKIRDTEGLYAIGAGDYKDNYKPGAPLSGMFEQIIQPGDQDMVVCHQMKDLAEKFLVLLKGCHDSWDTKTGGKDFLETLCDITSSVNLWHGGEITIKLGDQEYLWRARHKYKYSSSLNLENAMRRIMEIQGPSDIASEAHWHNAYIMDRHIMGEYRILMRSGSYKVWDEHGQQIAGYKGKESVPMIILFPNERKIAYHRNLDTGIEILKGLRK